MRWVPGWRTFVHLFWGAGMVWLILFLVGGKTLRSAIAASVVAMVVGVIVAVSSYLDGP